VIIRTIAVKCDRCRKKVQPVGVTTAEEVRQHARWAGWTTGKRGDFCRDHKAGA